jgi:hypothetical protein
MRYASTEHGKWLGSGGGQPSCGQKCEFDSVFSHFQ